MKYISVWSVAMYHLWSFSSPFSMPFFTGANFEVFANVSQFCCRHSRVGIVLHTVGCDSKENVAWASRVSYNIGEWERDHKLVPVRLAIDAREGPPGQAQGAAIHQVRSQNHCTLLSWGLGPSDLHQLEGRTCWQPKIQWVKGKLAYLILQSEPSEAAFS